ncbi:MAG: hypothetical protein RLZZ245_1678 [Verrucomicrobiota bacterium]
MINWRFVALKVAVSEIHGDIVIRQWASIGWEVEISDRGIFRLGVGNIHRCPDFDQIEEFGR